MSAPRERPPTIIDVARLAGVSKTTVARVLTGADNVRAETRELVEQVVRDCGYQRNHLAFGLRTGTSRTLGLVIPDIANPFWADVARGAQDMAERHGRSLLIFNSDWDPERERRHLLVLRQARVDGIVLNPVADDLGGLESGDLPVVVIGSSSERFPEISGVRSDIAQGLQLALDHLVENGHRLSGLLMGRGRRVALQRFLQAVAQHCRARGVDPTALPMEGEYTVDSGIAAMQRLLARGPVSAVLAANDLMAFGAILAARDAGLAVPRDISVIGVDGIAAGAIVDPGLTTVEKPRYELGAEATAMLIDQLEGGSPGQHRVLPCRLVRRGSVGRLREVVAA